MRIKSQLSIVCLLFSFTLFSQQSNFPTVTADIHNSCDGSDGSIQIDLVGDLSNINFHWDHGPEDLFISNLIPGDYTFILEDIFGCIEEHQFTVGITPPCSVDGILSLVSQCIIQIDLIVLDPINPIAEENLEILWSDNVVGGLSRQFNRQRFLDYDICATVSSTNHPCCVEEICFTITANYNCGIEALIYGGDVLIVNETYAAPLGETSFIELLVAGP